ncbi:hypothetical protein [Nonomuraea salmonea]|uniref:hypothetical protein n=1 Tax=Nonomuraea salmonea TaxID=46181 RepID=UPI0031EA66DD
MEGHLVITEDEYLYYVDRALDGMAAIVAELGDEGGQHQAAARRQLPVRAAHPLPGRDLVLGGGRSCRDARWPATATPSSSARDPSGRCWRR